VYNRIPTASVERGQIAIVHGQFYVNVDKLNNWSFSAALETTVVAQDVKKFVPSSGRYSAASEYGDY
jgi:hypothetical protein